jgi:hypothetical protein
MKGKDFKPTKYFQRLEVLAQHLEILKKEDSVLQIEFLCDIEMLRKYYRELNRLCYDARMYPPSRNLVFDEKRKTILKIIFDICQKNKILYKQHDIDSSYFLKSKKTFDFFIGSFLINDLLGF